MTRDELEILIGRYVDGICDDGEARALLAEVERSAETRELLTRHLYHEKTIRNFLVTAEAPRPARRARRRAAAKRESSRTRLTWAAVAAALILIGAYFALGTPPAPPPHFAKRGLNKNVPEQAPRAPKRVAIDRPGENQDDLPAPAPELPEKLEKETPAAPPRAPLNVAERDPELEETPSVERPRGPRKAEPVPRTAQPVARVALAEGGVRYRRLGGEGLADLVAGIKLMSGDRIETHSGSAVLEISGARVAVGRSSSLRVLSAGAKQADARLRVWLSGGRIVVTETEGSIEVATADGMVSPVGTTYGVSRVGGTTWVGVGDGRVQVRVRARATDYAGARAFGHGARTWIGDAVEVAANQDVKLKVGRQTRSARRANVAKLLSWANPLFVRARPALFAEDFSQDRPGRWTQGHGHGQPYGGRVQDGRLVFEPLHHNPGPGDAYWITHDSFGLDAPRVVTVTASRKSASQRIGVRIVAKLADGREKLFEWIAGAGRESLVAHVDKPPKGIASTWRGERPVRIEIGPRKARVLSRSKLVGEYEHGWGAGAKIRIALFAGATDRAVEPGGWAAFDDLTIR